MTESTRTANSQRNTRFQGAYSQSNEDKREKDKQKMTTSSQDVRYTQNLSQVHQSYTNYPYSNDYYYAGSASRGRYYAPRHYYNQQQRHHHYQQQQQQQQRRSQTRHVAPSAQASSQQAIRSFNRKLTTGATNDVENLRFTLIEQLSRNNYECMICITEIK
jgi:hypothetical protein